MSDERIEVDLAEVVNTQAAKISELEREVYSLKRELNWRKGNQSPPSWANEWTWREAYLTGKIRRQAEAIRKIQKVGWQPECIIREVPYEDDKHLWNEPRPQAQRREKRRPLKVIQGA